MTTETRQPVACACGWTGKRMTGQPVTCPKFGAWAAFQWQGEGKDNGN